MAHGSRYDSLILGGGTAGCALAAGLSEDPRRTVCLVEAGPDYGPFDAGAWPADLVDPREPSDSHDWYPRAEMSLSRARVIGGCSAHNAAFVVWGDRRDYDEWGLPGWDFDSIEPYLRRAERAISTRRLRDEELGRGREPCAGRRRRQGSRCSTTSMTSRAGRVRRISGQR